MAREHNFLLGSGERLASPVSIRKAGGAKNLPYSFSNAKSRIAERLENVEAYIQQLPDDACPRGETVAVVTMHPRFLSKSDFPIELLSSVGLRAVGSRSRRLKPEKWGLKEKPRDATTEDIFVAGARSAFQRWATSVKKWTEKTKGASSLGAIEDLSAFEAKSKIHALPDVVAPTFFEIVLHNAGSEEVVLDFVRFAMSREAEPILKKRRDVRGLTFLPVRLKPSQAEAIAQYSFVRVARGMPSLRPIRPSILRNANTFPVVLPQDEISDNKTRAVIFDGGIPIAAQEPLSRWVSPIEPADIGARKIDLEEHGLAVTSAFLFGTLASKTPPGRPICQVDHVRVLDKDSESNTGLFDVLERITKHLDDNLGRYSLVNISLGPRMAVDDNEVTLWTADLDRRFAHGQSVVTVACGNDGEFDAEAGLNRIQPPADGVNVLSVGAATTIGDDWERSTYSCIGPGRCPGVVKPDGLAFGGSDDEPFGVLRPTLKGDFEKGTSFAAPLALRSAAAISAQIGNRVTPLSIRALMIHRASITAAHDWKQVGWGRFETDPLKLVTCDDDEFVVVFQGTLPVGEHLRAPIPIENIALDGKVMLAATLVIAPEVDPEHASTYTRSGLEVTFRPNSQKFAKARKGVRPKHAKTKSFFSASNLYGQAEAVLREDGHKWEPCLHHETQLKAASLSNPCFDIYYHHRENGTAATDPSPIPYALVVSLKAPNVPDLYNQVVRNYANILTPLRPSIQLQVRTKGVG